MLNDKRIDSVVVLGICDLVITLFGPDHYSIFFGEPGYVDYQTQGKRVIEWCKANGAHYYARPGEDFSEYEAKVETAEAGLFLVVVEDLS